MRKIQLTLYSTNSIIDVNVDDIVTFNNDRWSSVIDVRSGFKEVSMFVKESITEIARKIKNSFTHCWQVDLQSSTKPEWVEYLIKERFISIIRNRLCVNKFNYYINSTDYLVFDEVTEEAFLVRKSVTDLINLLSS